jgi:hypothetical protein
LPGADVLDAIEALVRIFRQDAQHFRVRGFGDVDRRAPLTQNLRERTNVIRMFVGDDDAIEAIHGAPDFGQTP